MTPGFFSLGYLKVVQLGRPCKTSKVLQRLQKHSEAAFWGCVQVGVIPGICFESLTPTSHSAPRSFGAIQRSYSSRNLHSLYGSILWSDCFAFHQFSSIYIVSTSVHAFSKCIKPFNMVKYQNLSSSAGNIAIPYARELSSVSLTLGSKMDTLRSSAISLKDTSGIRAVRTQLSGLRVVCLSWFRAWGCKKCE